eukprot:797531-Rhodomonas_salina.1
MLLLHRSESLAHLQAGRARRDMSGGATSRGMTVSERRRFSGAMGNMPWLIVARRFTWSWDAEQTSQHMQTREAAATRGTD